jgi:hypothetical protein
MTTTTVAVCVGDEVDGHRCPLCNAVLDPESDALLCPECEQDHAERWADYIAEQQQARRPF